MQSSTQNAHKISVLHYVCWPDIRAEQWKLPMHFFRLIEGCKLLHIGEKGSFHLAMQGICSILWLQSFFFLILTSDSGGPIQKETWQHSKYC